MNIYNKETLTDMIKAVGEELISKADSFVGETEFLDDFTIWLRFPKDSLPEIEVQQDYISKNSLRVLERTN